MSHMNNNQYSFKDTTAVFETLANSQQEIEQVNHKQIVLPRSALTHKVKKVPALPGFVEDLMKTAAVMMIPVGTVGATMIMLFH